jgi:SAM-dependent methyltransferase
VTSADAGLPANIGAPATRALISAGYTELRQLSGVPVSDLRKLHGVGPKALRLLQEALERQGLSLGLGPARDLMTTPEWDAAYTAAEPAPWDIGRPQPAFVRLANDGLLTGRLLDAGCGSGEQTLLAASRGAQAIGVDVSPTAIERARGKAADRGITARFEVADALSLGQLGLTFDTVTDSGLFHVFNDDDRARYVTSLASVLRPGGSCYLMCFSDRQPGTFGPRRVSQDELRAAFGDGWTVASITADAFEVNRGFGATTAQAWLATIRRA